MSPAWCGGQERNEAKPSGHPGRLPLASEGGWSPPLTHHPLQPGLCECVRWESTRGLVTWRLKSLCSRPFLGAAGGRPFQSRSGGTEPSSPKTFSSWKHSVSTICAGPSVSECQPLPSTEDSPTEDCTPPHFAREWAHCPWRTSGRSPGRRAPAPHPSQWKTARCPGHPYNKWPEAVGAKDSGDGVRGLRGTDTGLQIHALHVANPDSILASHMVSQAPPEETPELR